MPSSKLERFVPAHCRLPKRRPVKANQPIQHPTLCWTRIPESRMSVMPITEIIHEIDAYVSRLRQARELLLDQRTEAPQKRVPRRKGKVAPGEGDPASSRSRQTTRNKSRSDHPVVHLNRGTERVEIAPRSRSPERSTPQIWSSRRSLRRNASYRSMSL